MTHVVNKKALSMIQLITTLFYLYSDFICIHPIPSPLRLQITKVRLANVPGNPSDMLPYFLPSL